MTGFLGNLITRPPRSEYKENDLGANLMLNDGSMCKRVPVKFPNKRNQSIIGSFYPSPSQAPGNPCLIYLHGNASSQREGGQWIPFTLCPLGVNVLCIDTSGSGISDGEYISLGYFERDDVQASIDFIRKTFKVGAVSLWGRSMGAAIAAWCAADNFDLASIVVDSAYESIDEIIKDLIGDSWFLWGLSKLLVPFVNRRVVKNIGISMDKIDIMENLGKAKTPALFIHAARDTFINVREARDIFAKYGGKTKFLMTTNGDHNSVRPKPVKIATISFILSHFDIDSFDIEFENDFDNSNAHYENAFDMMKDM